MSTTTPPVGITIVRPPPREQRVARRGSARWRVGVEPPGRKLLSGEVTTRSGGTQTPWPPLRQLPYWTL